MIIDQQEANSILVVKTCASNNSEGVEDREYVRQVHHVEKRLVASSHVYQRSRTA